MPAENAAPQPGKAPRRTLSREAWIAAARRVLEAKGIGSVKVDHLARRLGVTRGSFYFHFRDRKDLLGALLDDWRQRNCEPFGRLAREAGLDGAALYEAITDFWLPHGDFSPELDLAIRDWARLSKPVAAAVREADETRIDLLVKALEAMGHGRDEAVVRARISYLHQIGYISVRLSEPLAERLRFVPLYLKVLTGRDGWQERTPRRAETVRFSRAGSAAADPRKSASKTSD